MTNVVICSNKTAALLSSAVMYAMAVYVFFTTSTPTLSDDPILNQTLVAVWENTHSSTVNLHWFLLVTLVCFTTSFITTVLKVGQ